jgi:hypothetical protein
MAEILARSRRPWGLAAPLLILALVVVLMEYLGIVPD